MSSTAPSGTRTPRPGTVGTLDRYFEITARGSSWAREARGGIVTFVTMAYIVILNPLILGGFTADQAKDYGIIDHVTTRRGEMS